MTRDQVALGRRLWTILCVCGLLNLAGCSDFPKLYPVSGKVTLDGQPLTGGGLAFVPDTAKGNTAPVDCKCLIDSQGHYELKSRGVKGSDNGKGAPLGRYKVILVANPKDAKVPEINVNARYLKAETTPLSIEVVADPKPDAYDLQLTK